MNQASFLNSGLEVERRARDLLSETLARIPFLHVRSVQANVIANDGGVDLAVEISIDGSGTWTLIGQVNVNAQPAIARLDIAKMQSALRQWPPQTYGVLIAPFLSERTRTICTEQGVGYLDFSGNCRLCFDHVFIETTAPKAREPSPKKIWKGLFGTKSGRALRRLLAEPRRSWKVAELAAESGVSVGLVSNIRRALIEQEWGIADDDGLRIGQPDALLDAWKIAYRPATGLRTLYHTILHGEALMDAIRAVNAQAGTSPHAVLAGLSAAQWLAPYAAAGTQHFHADEHGVASLLDHLRLKPAPRGANVVIARSKDEGVFLDAVEPSPGIWCTDPVQTYLDLTAGNDRALEAAEHLRRERIAPRFGV